jgi:hypothetical protein
MRTLGATWVVLVVVCVGASAGAAASSTIFFSTTDLHFKGKLWSIHANGSGRTLLRHSVTAGPSGVIAVISRNKKRILCLCRGGQVDSMRLDGSGMHAIGHRPPDTKYDVVGLGAGGETLWIDERHNRLMMEDADGSHRRVVGTASHGRIVEENFTVSRAGDKVAFTTGRCVDSLCLEGEEDVWIAPLSGGPKTLAFQLIAQREIGELQWSQDGSTLSFVDFPVVEKYEIPEDPKEHLHLYANGSAHELVVEEPAGPSGAFFSPDGRELAVASANYPVALYTVPLSGMQPHLLLRSKCQPSNCLFPPAVFGWLDR